MKCEKAKNFTESLLQNVFMNIYKLLKIDIKLLQKLKRPKFQQAKKYKTKVLIRAANYSVFIVSIDIEIQQENTMVNNKTMSKSTANKLCKTATI